MDVQLPRYGSLVGSHKTQLLTTRWRTPQPKLHFVMRFLESSMPWPQGNQEISHFGGWLIENTLLFLVLKNWIVNLEAMGLVRMLAKKMKKIMNSMIKSPRWTGRWRKVCNWMATMGSDGGFDLIINKKSQSWLGSPPRPRHTHSRLLSTLILQVSLLESTEDSPIPSSHPSRTLVPHKTPSVPAGKKRYAFSLVRIKYLVSS